ncbi:MULTISPECIES: nitroreductase family protein [unclassified Paenibacillus]|uniref:nitroreductase family protein n=1 Tax=unclassified Paenibacillus TaxID=185978 RepID=UPI002F402F0E
MSVTEQQREEQARVVNADEQGLLTIMNGRRAVRHYDTSAVISEEEIADILKQATRAPSSSNMQPWRFIVVTDPELKQKLVPIANNQKQVGEASAIILIIADTEMYKKTEQIFGTALDAGFITEEVKEKMSANSIKLYSSIPYDRLKEIVLFDAGLVSMNIMLLAHARGYDTVPMGGYNRDQVKALFELSDRYIPALMLPIGKAAAAGHPSARLPIQEVLAFNKMPE